MQALDAADAAQVAAVTASQAALDGVWSRCTSALSSDQLATIAAITRNSGRELPTEYLVVDRTDVQWLALRNALAAVRIAVQQGTSPPEGTQQAVDAARSDPAVASAITGLVNLAAIKDAWQSAATVP